MRNKGTPDLTSQIFAASSHESTGDNLRLQHLNKSEGKQGSQGRTGREGLSRRGRVSATPEPFNTSTLPKDPGAEDTANKARLVCNSTGIAYVRERLDALMKILNNSICNCIHAYVSADHQPML